MHGDSHYIKIRSVGEASRMEDIFRLLTLKSMTSVTAMLPAENRVNRLFTAAIRQFVIGKGKRRGERGGSEYPDDVEGKRKSLKDEIFSESIDSRNFLEVQEKQKQNYGFPKQLYVLLTD